MLQFTTNRTANYTAAVNEFVRADCSAGSFTVTLPANPSTDDQVGVILRDTNTGTNSNTVTVAANTGDTIFGEGSSLKLFVEGDFVVFQFHSADGWMIVDERRQPHSASMASSTSSAQNFPSDTYVEVNFVTVLFDNAGLASTGGNSMTIRRAGRYQIAIRANLVNFTSNGRVSVSLRKNGSEVSLAFSLNDAVSPVLTDVLQLEVDDELTVQVQQGSQTGVSASINDALRPKISITEIR